MRNSETTPNHEKHPSQTKAHTGVGGAVVEEVSLSNSKIQWTVTTVNPNGGAAITTSGGYDLVSER